MKGEQDKDGNSLVTFTFETLFFSRLPCLQITSKDSSCFKAILASKLNFIF